MRATEQLEKIKKELEDLVDTLQKTSDEMKRRGDAPLAEIRWLVTTKMKFEQLLKYDFQNPQTKEIKDSIYWHNATVCDKWQEKYKIKLKK